jgi:hypothetical protein
VVEKLDDALNREVGESDVGDLALSRIGDERKEQAQAVAIREHRVPANATVPLEMNMEEALDEAEQWIRTSHDRSLRRRRAANRRLASSSSSAVAVR